MKPSLLVLLRTNKEGIPPTEAKASSSAAKEWIGLQQAQAFFATYSVNTTHLCYYDEANLQQVVMKRQLFEGFELWLGMHIGVLIIFFGIGSYLIFLASPCCRRRRRKRHQADAGVSVNSDSKDYGTF